MTCPMCGGKTKPGKSQVDGDIRMQAIICKDCGMRGVALEQVKRCSNP